MDPYTSAPRPPDDASPLRTVPSEWGATAGGIAFPPALAFGLLVATAGRELVVTAGSRPAVAFPPRAAFPPTGVFGTGVAFPLFSNCTFLSLPGALSVPACEKAL